MSKANRSAVLAVAQETTEAAHPQSFIRYTHNGLRTRIFSILMLASVAGVIGYALNSAYWIQRDAFVVPAILSPESDLIITNKLKLSELAVERSRASAELMALDEDLAADDKGIQRLEDLNRMLEKSGQWASHVSAKHAESAASELRTLRKQQAITEGMLAEQEQLTRKAEGDLMNGTISRTAYAKEQQTLHQLQVSLLEKKRSAFQLSATLHELGLVRRSLADPNSSPLAPELAGREEHKVRIELESMRLQADKRAKLAQRGALTQRIAKLEEVEQQLKGRPLFQAAEKRLEVAFVPYTQLEGIQRDDKVYHCIWGLFNCKPVGVVRELVAGESLHQDPWGVPSRGQYAVLSLWSHDAARAKTLRVRGNGGPMQDNGLLEQPIAKR